MQFFHFVESFDKLHNLEDKFSIWMLEDNIQKLDNYTCETFQFFFFENLFNPSENSKIQNHKNMTKQNTRDIVKRTIYNKRKPKQKQYEKLHAKGTNET